MGAVGRRVHRRPILWGRIAMAPARSVGRRSCARRGRHRAIVTGWGRQSKRDWRRICYRSSTMLAGNKLALLTSHLFPWPARAGVRHAARFATWAGSWDPVRIGPARTKRAPPAMGAGAAESLYL